MKVCDVAIIGAGPAGLTAAVFTARAQLQTLLFYKPSEGMILEAAALGNYIGCDGWSGEQFLVAGLEQVRKYGAQVKTAEVVHLEKREQGILLRTQDQQEFVAKAVVIATGEGYLSSGFEGEKQFTGKGVHYCVACDGWPYKNKRVAVVGHGSYAADQALELLAYTKNITLFSNGQPFEISPPFQAALQKAGVPLRTDRIKGVAGEKFVQSLVLEDGKTLAVDGVFVALGTATAIAFADKLGLEKQDGTLVINRASGQTNVPGIYAAGGCTGGNVQVAKSAGEGCNAALSIIRQLTGKAYYVDQT